MALVRGLLGSDLQRDGLGGALLHDEVVQRLQQHTRHGTQSGMNFFFFFRINYRVSQTQRKPVHPTQFGSVHQEESHGVLNRAFGVETWGKKPSREGNWMRKRRNFPDFLAGVLHGLLKALRRPKGQETHAGRTLFSENWTDSET